jgi:DNA-binding transcriptional LysR family regulator
MDILQLEHFLAVADERTFTRAAERVFRTQPALSQSIKKLEDNIGSPLFARDIHDVSLTEAGKMLEDYARRIIGLRDEAIKSIAQLQNLKTGSLAIAAHESAAVYLLPGTVRQFLQLFPHIRVSIHRSKLDEIPKRVMDREVQIGFVKDPPVFRDLDAVDVHSDEMTLIASPRSMFSSKKQIDIHELDNVPFVVHHLCSSTDEIIHRLFRQNGLRCKVVAELWSFENIKSFVHEDVGMAIVPRITVMQELKQRTLVEIPLLQLKIPRSTVMIFRRDYVSESAQEFIKIMRSIYASPLHLPGSGRFQPSNSTGRASALGGRSSALPKLT